MIPRWLGESTGGLFRLALLGALVGVSPSANMNLVFALSEELRHGDEAQISWDPESNECSLVSPSSSCAILRSVLANRFSIGKVVESMFDESASSPTEICGLALARTIHEPRAFRTPAPSRVPAMHPTAARLPMSPLISS